MSKERIGSIKDHTPNFKIIIPRFDLATWHDYIEENFRNIDALFFNLFGINNYSGPWKQITSYTEGQVLFITDDRDINGEETIYAGRLVKVLVDHVTDNSDYFNVFYNLHPEYYELFADAGAAQIFAQQAQDASKEAKNSENVIIQKQIEINDAITEFNANVVVKTEELSQQIAEGIEVVEQNTQIAIDNAEKSRIFAIGEQEEVETLGGTLSSRGHADLAMAIANADEDTPIDASGLIALDVIKGPKGDKGDKGENGKDGGGLEIGDIAPTVFGIDETKNLRRYLNGQVISQTQFETFTNIIKERAKLYPNIITTEENWQAEVTNSKLGQCGKFVIDDTLGTIRLPKVVNINGLQDLALMGSVKAESLPNITGNSGTMSGTTTGGTSGQNQFGALSIEKGASSNGATHSSASGNIPYAVTLNASNSSSTYQDNAPVQQEAIQYPYFIQVATGVEESVDVTREIELNNPFSLLDYKWSEYELNNASWLLSNGAFHSGTVYKAVYELLLKLHNGTETKEGVSVKLSTEAYTDTDFVLNTADTTFRLPIKVKLASGNAVIGNGMNLGLTDGTNNVGLQVGVAATNAGLGASVANYGGDVGTGVVISGWSSNKTMGVTTDPTKSGIETSSNGLKLYFYVGETIQDANLINVGNVFEQLATKTDSVQAAAASMPSDKYIDLTLGASGTTYTAPANGWVDFIKNSSGAGQVINLSTNGKIGFQIVSTASNQALRVALPVLRGDKFVCSYTAGGTTPNFRFVYAEGEE